jgi:hypothetical protein
MAARLAGIGPLRWRIRPGEGWRKKRSSPLADLWPQTGGKTVGDDRPAAPRRPGRGAPRSGVLRPGRGGGGAGKVVGMLRSSEVLGWCWKFRRKGSPAVSCQAATAATPSLQRGGEENELGTAQMRATDCGFKP